MPNDNTSPPPDPDLAVQLASLKLDAAKPLIISDADEVILKFVQALEQHLDRAGYTLKLRSYALTGNIHRHRDDAAADAATVKELLAGFFTASVDAIEPADGAVDALSQLAAGSNIVILSNVPSGVRNRRAAHLTELGLGFPVIANKGAKGTAVAHLSRLVQRPVFFIDDIPSHHAAVAGTAAHVHRIHYVADVRLAALCPTDVDCHLRAANWDDIVSYIEAVIDDGENSNATNPGPLS